MSRDQDQKRIQSREEFIENILDYDKEEDALSVLENWHVAAEDMMESGMPGMSPVISILQEAIEKVLNTRKEG